MKQSNKTSNDKKLTKNIQEGNSIQVLYENNYLLQLQKNCNICGFRLEKNIKNNEQGLLLMQCKICGMFCHSYCYGLSIQSNMIGQHLQGQVIEIECDGCKEKGKKVCMLCLKPGMLKKLSDHPDKFVHVPCALFSQQIEVMSYMSMNFATRIDAKRSKIHKCSCCGKNDATLACLADKCTNIIHPSCLIQEQIEGKQVWCLNLHFPMDNIQLNENKCDITEDIFNGELHQVLQIFIGVLENSNEPEEIQKQVKYQIEMVFAQMKRDFQSSYNTQSNQNSQPLQQAAQIQVYCPKHNSENQIYCVCATKQLLPAMVQCTECSQYYHPNCIEKKARNINRINFICKPCKEWFSKREKIGKLIIEPHLVELSIFSFPQNLNKVGFMDLVPIFIFLEQLCARFSCGLGEQLSPREFTILRKYRQLLNQSPLCPSYLIQLQKLQVKEILTNIIVSKKNQFYLMLGSLKSQYFNAIQQKFHGGGYNIDFIDELLQISKETAIMQQVGNVQMKLKQIKKIILDSKLIPNVIDIIKQHAKLHELPDLRKFILETRPYIINSLLHVLERYLQFQVLKQTTKDLLCSVNLTMELEDEAENYNDNDGDQLFFERKQNEQFFESLIRAQLTKPGQQKLQEILFQLEKTMIDSRFQIELKNLLKEVENIENSQLDDQTFQRIIEIPVTSQKMQKIIQIFYENSTILLLQKQLLLLLEGKVILTIQQKIKLFTEENLNRIFSLPLLPQLIKHEQEQFITLQNIIIQQKNKTELDYQFMEQIEANISKLTITSPLIEQFKTEVIEKITNLRQLVFGMYQLWYPDHKPQFQIAMDFIILQDFPSQPLQQLLQSTEILKSLEKNFEILKDYNQNKVQQLLKKFKLLLWRCQSDLIVHEANSEKPRIPKSLLRQLIEQQSEHQSLEHRDISAFRELKRLFSELQSWIEQYKSLGKNELVQTLECISIKQDQEAISQKQIAQQNYLFQKQTMELLRKAVKSPIDLSVEINALIALQLQIIWIWKSQTILNKNPTYQALLILQLYAKELQIPLNFSLYKQVEIKLNLFIQIKTQLKEYSQLRIEWQQDRERQIQNLKNVRQQLIYITRKPSYDYVQRIAQQVQDLNYISSETEFLQVDIENAEHMAFKFVQVMEESENIQQLKEIRRMMLYSFLKVDGIASQVSYYILKQSVKRLLENGHPTLNVLQQKLDDIKALCQLDQLIKSKIKLPLEDSEPIITEYSKQLKNFLLDETFEWVIETESNLRVDFLALSLQQRLKIGWESVSSQENEQMNENDRFGLRQQHFIKFSEVDDFMRNSMKNVRYLQKSDLQLLKAQYEGALYLRKSYEEMVERLKEFQLRLDIEAVETLIDEYLDGGVHLFIEEMFTLLQYLNMARTFWSEIQELREIMRQPILDARKNQFIHEKLNSLLVGWKKFNFEIPDVRKFFEEYSKVNQKLEEISNTIQYKNSNELVLIKQYLYKDVPQHLKCLDIYCQCCVQLWQTQVNEMLTEQFVWNYSRLIQEINEAYRILEILIGKQLIQLGNPLEQFESTQLIHKIYNSLLQLEQLCDEIEEINPEQKTLFKGKIDLDDRNTCNNQRIKPSENLLSLAEKTRQKNQAKYKQQGLHKKKTLLSLRVKPKGPVKSIIKIGKKPLEQQQTQQQDQITDNCRFEKRSSLVNQLKRHSIFLNPEKLGRQLENEIYVESLGKKEFYEKYYENFKSFFLTCSKQTVKKLGQKGLNFIRITKYIQLNNPNSSTPVAPKLVHVQSLKSEAESARKKPKDLTNKTPIKQQQQMVDSILYSLKKQMSEPEKNSRQLSGEEPQKKIKTESNAIFYNPDKDIITLQSVRQSDVFTIGTLSLKISSKNIIKPLFLSQDPFLMTTLIPDGFNDFCIHSKAQCPAQQVIEYFLSHKDQIKSLRGWILGKDFKESQELFNLAQTLRLQKNSMGARFYDNLLGVTILPIEYIIEKLHNFNHKWIVQKPVDQVLINEIDSFESLEIIKPQLGFILYIKDISAYKLYLEKNNKSKSQQISDFNYDSVYKIPKLNQLIETQKEIQKQQKFDERKTDDILIQKEYETAYPIIPKTPGYYEIKQSRGAFEPISDDEMNANYNYQNEDTGLHNMILNQVPNILSLLKEEK